MTARWITAALLLMASPLLGQEPGARVRVTAPAVSQEPFVGTYWGVRDDGTLAFTTEETEEIVGVSRDELELLEIHLGRHRHTIAGMTVGWLAGTAAGIALGATEASQSDSEWAGLAVVAGAVVGGAAGLVLGTVVGALAVTDEWQPVSPPAKPMVAVQPSGRFSVGLTIPVRR
jgi:hypothetical protein